MSFSSMIILQKLRVISKHTSSRYHNLEFARSIRVRKAYIDEFADDLERNPKDVFVSKELLANINRVYRIVKAHEPAQI